MRYKPIILIIIIIALYSDSYSIRKKARTHRSSHNWRTEWFKSRHQFNKYRYYSDTNEQNKLKIKVGQHTGKPITVEQCGISGIVHSRIVNGKNASYGEYPWMVSIHSTNGRLNCAGSILNERWVISAANCFRPLNKPPFSKQSLTIRVGSLYRRGGTVYKILKLVIHDLFNNDGMMNSDVALLKTTKPILMERRANRNVVNGICLPKNKYEEPRAKSLLVVGWGKLAESGEFPPNLKEVTLPIISDQQCSLTYRQPMEDFPDGFTIYRSQICAFSNNRDACKGDSGGPAMEMVNGRVILVGIVSYGIGCATSFPGIYTQVSWFLEWIANHMK